MQEQGGRRCELDCSLNNPRGPSRSECNPTEQKGGERESHDFSWKSVYERDFLASRLIIKLSLLLIYPLSIIYLLYYLFFIDHEILSFINTVFAAIYCFFMFSGLIYIRNILYSTYCFKAVGKFNLSIDDIINCANWLNKSIPKITILVPARNEGYVIENTIRRLIKLDYIKNLYRIFVITDERELDDNVEILTKTVVDRVAEEVNRHYGTNIVQSIEVPKWVSSQ